MHFEVLKGKIYKNTINKLNDGPMPAVQQLQRQAFARAFSENRAYKDRYVDFSPATHPGAGAAASQGGSNASKDGTEGLPQDPRKVSTRDRVLREGLLNDFYGGGLSSSSKGNQSEILAPKSKGSLGPDMQ